MALIINAKTKEVVEVPDEFDPITAEAYRKLRDKLLSDTDWTQVPDAPVDQVAWAEYRQALRDVPQQEGFPDNIVWPYRPDAPPIPEELNNV